MTIWTIGHSTHPIDVFMDMVSGFGLQALVDVRRFPTSKRHPQFNKDDLKKALESVGIVYAHAPELGGRRNPLADSPNRGLRNPSFRGYADHMLGDEFMGGIGRIITLAERQRVALMCAEALWWKCHRSLISDYLVTNNHMVLHIHSVDESVDHKCSADARVVGGRLLYPLPETPLGL